jgi:hypothetical protein
MSASDNRPCDDAGFRNPLEFDRGYQAYIDLTVTQLIGAFGRSM